MIERRSTSDKGNKCMVAPGTTPLSAMVSSSRNGSGPTARRRCSPEPNSASN